ncbi:PREDICTED: uncharacterized protein LOC109583923 [Amphimedon queenslandica]|uniref:Death domain-containing protein n=1 Tax=Amphimedon queenslandica TaxID=400682 RepID=A0AAN0JE16_AMPQE|nr:PREDICTED: uncharacterized protein LOC109583923 [Amphimedon queenslandica]|eukprot:XP_019855006.1 PREDICTED: uncharacterized protein LOC109583923 [Amphimedon queenslandica]
MATNLGLDDAFYVEELLINSHFPVTEWYELGKKLGLSKNTLGIIESNYRHDASRCLTECLAKWLSRADNVDSKGGATIDSLINALESMGHTAVADKMKIHIIIKNHLPSLSQSLCDLSTTVYWLYEEHVLTREVVTVVESASPSVPNQREALLTAVKEAVQNSKNLQTFARVLSNSTNSTNVQLGLAIQKDINKYFPPLKVGIEPQDNENMDETKSPLPIQVQSTPSLLDSAGDTKIDSNSQPLSPRFEVRVPVPQKLEKQFNSIRRSHGMMFLNIRELIQKKSLSLESIQKILSFCTSNNTTLQKIAKCSNVSSVIEVLRDECSLTDIGLLECVVEELNITEAEEYIEKYMTKLGEFCKSIEIDLCLKERFDSIPHLQWETVTLVFDWEPEKHMLKDIRVILSEVSGKLLVIKRQDVRQKELHKKKQGLQDTEIISFFILEETKGRLRDAISCKEKKAFELKQKISEVLRHRRNEQLAGDGRCPFRVKIPGLGCIYWLFDLPDDSSPIIKQYTKNLLQACDLALADSACIKSIINRSVSVIQTCSKRDAICLGSQCNRLTKYIEATDIYLFFFKDIAMWIAKKLQYTMECLYDCRPPRETEAKLLLQSIDGLSEVVLKATDMRLLLVMKMATITHEGFTTFLQFENTIQEAYSYCTLAHFSNNDQRLAEPDDAETLAILNDATHSLFVLWEEIAKWLRTIVSLTGDIKQNTPQVQDKNFDEFKVKVITISASWIALSKMCFKYINHIKPQEFQNSIEATFPLQSIDDVISNLSTLFDDIEAHLLSYSDRDLQLEDSIKVYGSWVQPKMDTTVYQCSDLAREAKELLLSFDFVKASKKLVEIEQQSKHIAIMVKIYLKRLHVIEAYAECQQENIMKKRHKLESEVKDKEEKQNELEMDLAKANQQHNHYETRKKELQNKKKEVEKQKKDCKSSLQKLSKTSLKYLYTKSIIIDLEKRVQVSKNNIKLNEFSRKKSRGYIKNKESQIQRLRKGIKILSQELEKLRQKSNYGIERLQEMKKATADLKKSTFLWNAFSVNVERGETRSVKALWLVQTANKSKNKERVLGSKGMQTALKSFTDAFTTVEHLFTKQWQCVIVYDYTCDMCESPKNGLPLPVDENTVVCCDCAQKFVE